MKKVFNRSPETLPNILCGGHRKPYQFKNAIKSGGTVLGLNSLPVSCVATQLKLSLVFCKLNSNMLFIFTKVRFRWSIQFVNFRACLFLETKKVY